MPVIAMTREMGSLGKDVAMGLAEELGLSVIHHELVEQDLAKKLHVQESTVHRFLEGRASLLERWKIDESTLSLYTAEEILELASAGNVLIRGWGASYLLRPISHVLCVRVCAPMAFRVRVLMERLGIDDEHLARREIERNDAAHSRTMLHLFGVNWESPLLYDLVLNTERVPIDDCIAQVCALVRKPAFQETEASRTTLANRMLEAKVSTAVRTRFGRPTHDLIVDVSVDAEAGKVVLTGVADSAEKIHQLSEVVKGVTGVSDVDNRLTCMTLHARE